jgi:hypothetical protein
MRYTIMTEKLARRGTYVPTENIAVDPSQLAELDAAAVRTRNIALLTPSQRKRRATEHRGREIL